MQFNSQLMQLLKNCYDIRSTQITNEDAFLLAKAFASEIIERNKKTVIVGYDRRKNSKELNDNFIQGLYHSGINVISLGITTTAIVQIAEIELKADASVMITASHNPAHYNGFKFFLENNAFSDNNLAKLVLRIMQNQFKIATGKITSINFNKQYAKCIHEHINIAGKFKIAWDCLNGCAGEILYNLTSSLNGINYIINHEKDSTFGNCAPDPTYEPRLDLIKNIIQEKKLDFGIAIDGDADRCVIIDKNGKIIPGDKLLALFAYLMKEKNKIVIWDSKSSNSLIKWAKDFCECHISATGHSNLYNLFKKTNANLAGECSGHYIFSEFFGVNDGIFSALKFINLLEMHNIDLERALSLIPNIWVAEAINIPCHESKKEQIMNQIENILIKKGATINLNDGIKASYATGWWLIRPSRTEEALRISAEGWTQEGLEIVKDEMNCILSIIEFD